MPSVEDRELWIRAPDNAVRLATIVAVFRGSARVEVEDLEWAIELVSVSMRHLGRGLRDHALEDLDRADLVERIRSQFHSAKPEKGGQWQGKKVLTHGKIRKHCERWTSDYRKIDECIHHLVICGEIAELGASRNPGLPTRRWEWMGDNSGI
jgi:hypothetical protein